MTHATLPPEAPEVFLNKKTKKRILINEKLPTVNHLYWHRNNIKIMKTEAKELRERIIELVHLANLSEQLTPQPLQATITIYEDWLCKNGEVKKKDIANREKFLIDSVMKGFDIDDKYLYKITMLKVQSELEYSEVIIESYDI